MNSQKTYYIDNILIARRYLIASIAVAIAGGIYEMFSHGVYSGYMVYAFMIPLVLGSLTHLADTRGIFHAGGKTAEMLLLAAVATFTTGTLIRGALDIYGTTNALTTVYPIAGLLLLLAAIGICTYRRRILPN